MSIATLQKDQQFLNCHLSHTGIWGMDAKQLCLSGHKIIQFLFMGTLGIRMGRELAPRTDLWESTDSECLDQRQRQGEVSGGSWDPDPRFEMFTANQ